MSRRSCGLRDSEMSGSSNTIWFTSTSMSDLQESTQSWVSPSWIYDNDTSQRWMGTLRTRR